MTVQDAPAERCTVCGYRYVAMWVVDGTCRSCIEQAEFRSSAGAAGVCQSLRAGSDTRRANPIPGSGRRLRTCGT